MNAPAAKRTSASTAGWLFVLLMLGWLAFIFVPWPRTSKVAHTAVPPPVNSKLHAVGLADNPDWEGMPEIFAIWADHAEWKAGRTRFAYWHPVMKTYTYFFEAGRTETGFRFKEIAEPHDASYLWDESLGEECPIRFYKSGPAPAPLISREGGSATNDSIRPEVSREKLKLKVEAVAPRIQAPEAETPLVNSHSKP